MFKSISSNPRRLQRPFMLSALSLALLLTGCTVGPDYQAPTTLSASQSMPTLAAGNPGDAASTSALTQWWQGFADAELSRLIGTALEQNQTLAAAEANVARAYAVFTDSDDNHWPKLQPGVSYQASATPAELSVSGQRSINRQLQTGTGLSWDLDLAGQLRRASEAASARADEAGFAWQQAQLSLIAQVAQNLADYRGAALRLSVAEQNLRNLAQTSELVKARRDAGMASDLELTRVQAQRYQLESTLPDFVLAKRRAELTIAALLGQSVDSLQLQQSLPLPALAAPQALAEVSASLQYRPDVAMAERRLAAAVADIGVATAQLYPSLSLNGFLGFIAAPEFSFGSAQKAWSVAPSLNWQGADWGSVQARIKAANASEQMALAEFRQTVQDALAQMQLSLDSYNLSRRQQLLQQQQLQATEQAVALASARFQAGHADFLELLDAQRELLAARDQQARLTQQNFSRLVDIYRSFAGQLPSPAAVMGTAAGQTEVLAQG